MPEARESGRTRRQRWLFNFFPVFRGTGGRITFIASDYSEVRVRIPLSWRTRNYVGTIYGGSMYAAVDPVYMIQLMKRLGPDFVVWDKAASIRFWHPGRETLYVQFLMPDEEIAAVRAALEEAESVERDYTCELRNADGKLHATVEKRIYIRRKE